MPQPHPAEARTEGGDELHYKSIKLCFSFNALSTAWLSLSRVLHRQKKEKLLCRNSSFKFWLGVTTHPSTGWMMGWTDGLHIRGRVISKRAFVKYYSSIVAQMHDSVFCAYLCFSRVAGVDDGNACCHHNQSVRRKKELNQVQSCALTPGQRQAGRQPAGA